MLEASDTKKKLLKEADNIMLMLQEHGLKVNLILEGRSRRVIQVILDETF
jgi:hypothetical protein